MAISLSDPPADPDAPPPGAFVDFFSLLARRAEAAPERRALTFRRRDGGRVDLTYGELVARAGSMARVLAGRVAPGDRVLLLLPAEAEFAVAFLGCLAAGIVAVPLPVPRNAAAQRRVAAVAAGCSPAAIVSLADVRAAVAGGPDELRAVTDLDWILVDAVPEEGDDPGAAPLPSLTETDLAFLQYTSGSTAMPRGVMVSHGNLMANEGAIQEAFGVTADSTVVSWLPLHHDMGLIGGLLQPLYAGARTVILDPMAFVRRPVTWLRVIAEERADISGAPNFAYDLCVRTIDAAARESLDLSSWRVAFNGAAQVFPDTLAAFSEAFAGAGFRPGAHVPCYGLAEATLLVARGGGRETAATRWFAAAALEAGEAAEVEPGAPGGRQLVAYDLPPHATVRIVDPDTGKPVGEGRLGEIVVAGPSTGLGYWGDAAATESTFGLELAGEPEPFVRTGDLGFLHAGQLHIGGRAKDLIVHRGRNLHPADLEADLPAADEGIRPGTGAVFSVPHDGDEAVVVCQEVRAGSTPAERYPEVAGAIRTTLGQAHGVTPRTVLLVPPRTVPKTTSGKVQRAALRRGYLAGELEPLYESTLAERVPAGPTLQERVLESRRRSAGAPFAELVEAVTAALCEHLAEALGLPHRPDGGEPLTALGADSLLAVHLQNELEEALGTVLRPTTMLRAGSVREIVAAALGEEPAPLPPPAGARGVYELTETQRALWFLQHAYPDSYAYNVTRAFRLTGDVDDGVLEAALGALVAAHPSLRLAVHDEAGQPRPVVHDHRPVPLARVDGRHWSPPDLAAWYEAFATSPFDLARDPLLRAALVRRPDHWLVVLSLHHIACDMASLALMVDELAAAYRAEQGVESPEPALPPAPVSPAAREQAMLAADGDRLRAYWRQTLDGELPVLALPRLGMIPRPAPGWRGAGADVAFTVPAGVVAALERFAREAGLTLHNVLLAAYQVLLHRLTGQADLLVGIPTMGRDDRRLESWVGYLINAVPVRSGYSPHVPFADFARRTHQRMLDALDHRDLPLSAITRLVNPDRRDASTTLFQAMFEYYSTALPGGANAAAAVMGDPGAGVAMGGCTLAGEPMPELTAQSDVSMNVAVTSGGVGFRVQYSTESVSTEQAGQLAATFPALLAAIAADPGAPLRSLAISTPAEVQQRVAAGLGPAVPRPEQYVESFERLAAARPDAPAVDDGTVRLTYGELDRRANHVAGRLRAHGVGIDGNVVVCAARRTGYLVGVVGIHKADGSYVPISPTEAPRRAAAMIDAVRPVAAIADAAGRRLLERALAVAGTGPGLPVLDLAEVVVGEAAAAPAHACPGAAAGFVIHTSGSTGTPKSVVVTNDGMTNHIWQMLEHFDFGPDDCLAQTAPVSFDISVWQLLAPLAAGGRVRIVPEPDSQSPAALLDAVRAGGVSVLELVPSMIVALLDAGLAASPGALRVMISTGDTLTEDVAERWRTELPAIPLYNAYGPAECSDDVTMGLCALGTERPLSWSIGRPLANTSVLVLDDELVPVPPGVVGTLCVGGMAVGRGYRGDPRRTAQAFLPDPWSPEPGGRLYYTGDLGRAGPDGDLEFLGRADTQLKIRGIRIEAGEVEAALRACPGVGAAVVKVEPGASGVVLAGYVVFGPEEPGRGLRPEETRVLSPAEEEPLRAVLEERLPRQMIPTILVRIPRLPRSANGKLDYAALVHTDAAVPDVDPGDRFSDPLSATVRTIWADVLDRPAVAWQESFFHLGGHSLLALEMLDKVGRAVGVQLDVDTVFAYPRLGDFVEAVRRADRPPPDLQRTPGAPAGQAAEVPASAAQQRFWYLHELEPGEPTYNMPGVLRLRGRLDEVALEEALREVAGRHPVLLARFSEDGGALTWTAAPPAELALDRLDFRGMVAELGEEAFDQFVRAEAARPFDLRRELPFRTLLARLKAEDWALLVTIDHIVCDGVSLSIFLTDLAAGYNRRVAGGQAGGAAAGAPRHYTFADYCREEAAWLAGKGRDEEAALWHGAAAEPLARSPLPRRSGSAPHPGAGRLWRPVDAELAAGIHSAAARAGTTPFIVFATALAALTHGGSRARETIVLGTLIAQRDRPEWQRVVGPLLNVSIVAARLALTDTGEDALRHTRDAALRAYRSRHLPFQDLARMFPAAPGGDGSPFEVMLVMQPATSVPQFAGLAATLVELEPEGAPYPLTIDIEPAGDGYRLAYRYDPARHAEEDVQTLAAAFDDVITMLVRRPERTLDEFRAPAGAAAGGGELR